MMEQYSSHEGEGRARGQLFSLAATYAADLAEGAPCATLAAAFEAKGYPLGDAALTKSYTEGGLEWHLHSAREGSTYLLKPSPSGVSVSEMSFESVDVGFAKVIADIVAHSYGCGSSALSSSKSLRQYLNSASFGQFWHGRLGNMVSNWYFYRGHARPSLIRMHRGGLGDVDPSWGAHLRPLGESSGRRFFWERVAEDDRRTQQDAVDEALNRESEERSIQVAVRLLGTPRFWGSSTERRQNWLFVRFGELILCCYENELLKAFRACSVSDEMKMGHLEHSLGERFASCCHAAWAEIVKIHGHGETTEDLCATARQWLHAILSRPDEYGDWHDRLIAPFSLHEGGICDAVVQPAEEFAVAWARAVCRCYPTCTIEQARLHLAHHWRFCPEAEGFYGTRNLVVFRLWAHGDDSPQEQGPVLVAPDRAGEPPFAAYFIATFYSDAIIDQYASLIQALLSNIAQRDIVAFATRSYASFVRADVSSRSFQHAVKSRCGVLGNAISNLRKLVGAEHPEEMASIENAITFLRRGSQLSRSLLKEWEIHSPVRVDVSDIIRSIVNILGDRRVRLVEPARPAIVMGEVRKLEQAVVEIVVNSLDFVNAETGAVTITVATSADRVEVHVEDNGCGIHPSLRGRLFKEYSCYPADRLGLGLAYARRVVDAHGGRLNEIGEWGRGAHFVASLPAATKGT